MFGSKSAVAVLIFVFLCVSPKLVLATVMQTHTATPTCAGGQCTLFFTGAGFTLTPSMNTAVLDIAVASPLHVELIDTDFSTESLLIEPISDQNRSQGLFFWLAQFFDENGQEVGQWSEGVSGSLGPTAGNLAIVRDFPLDSITFHSMRFTITLESNNPGDELVWSGTEFITMFSFDPASNVGEWTSPPGTTLPEPGTLTLLGLGLAGLGFAVRRRTVPTR